MRKEVAENKIVELKDYIEKYKKIDNGLEIQLEAELISLDEVREKRRDMTKKLEKLVLEIHPYAFKQMTGKDTRWYTSVKKEGEERKIVKKNTYQELIDYLVDYYSLKEEKKEITLRTMYPIWRNYKKSCTKKITTIRRIEADWKKFYLNDPIIDVPLSKMTRNQITEWLNKRIIEDNIVEKKRFYNLITIFKNIFIYCYDEELIEQNTFAKASYRKELLKEYQKPKDETQVFTKEEEERLITLAFDRFNENKRLTSFLAIPLLFQTGLRCGELVSLEITDYDKENRLLHISKSEIRDYEEKENGSLVYVGTAISDPKKQASVRDILLTEEACKVLDMIIEINDSNGQQDGNYIFVYNQKRIQTGAVLKSLYKLCDELGIERRSTHKIRKTTLTKMLDVCIKQDVADISAIRMFAGHVDESTLMKNYIFSTRKDEMGDLISKALSSDAWKHVGNIKNA